MSVLFIDSTLKKIYLDGDNDQFYVEINNAISHENYKSHLAEANGSDLKYLEATVSGWNFTDQNGEEVEFNKESLQRLSSKVIQPLATKILTHYGPDKKKEKNLNG